MAIMPVNLWIYGHNFETKNLVLPYETLSLHVIYFAALLIIGMVLKWKFPTTAGLIHKVGNYIGLLLVIIYIVTDIVAFPNMFLDITGVLYGVVLTLPLLGLFLGFILAYSFRQNVPVRRTIAIDCGLQNIPVVLAIISESFDLEIRVSFDTISNTSQQQRNILYIESNLTK
ncbi:solute carrier family 10 member 6 [Caerostris darwini]|uniref:Solute carrier family 10 member 6 n=1 Tax=Caerostris darwini TaxID=1538125 RepID=A0AAV4VBX9_9ARAC|nr:solute carrier family 10 member 6 [Caerostris darwini]